MTDVTCPVCKKTVTAEDMIHILYEREWMYVCGSCAAIYKSR